MTRELTGDESQRKGGVLTLRVLLGGWRGLLLPVICWLPRVWNSNASPWFSQGIAMGPRCLWTSPAAHLRSVGWRKTP